MAKIESTEVREAIERRRKTCLECTDPNNDYSVAFSDGYQFALKHIEQYVGVLEMGAEMMEKIRKGEKSHETNN